MREEAWPKSYALRLALLALAYLVTGKLGLLMAVPPGYATAVWPPSGIALAGLLVWGWRCFPAVWLGSFAVNVWGAVFGHQEQPLVQAVIPAACIAAGAAAQALAGTALVRRAVRDLNQLVTMRDVLLFLLLGGPVACVINASIGILTLVGTGALRIESAPFSWWTWWVGDSIGVLIFAPASMILLHRHTPLSKSRRTTVLLPIVIGFSVMAALFASMKQAQDESIRSTFEHKAEISAQRFGNFMKDYLEKLKAIQSFYSASSSVERDEFKEFTKIFLSDHPAFTALEWCPRIRADEREKFEASVRKEGLDGFVIRELAGDHGLRVSQARDEYFPITFIEPFEGVNLSVTGLDFNSEARRRDALWRAVRTGRISLTEPLRLVQNPDVPGFVAFLPIYRNGTPSRTQDSVIGVVTEIFDIRKIMNLFSESHHDKKMRLFISDTTGDGSVRPVIAWNLDDNTRILESETAVRDSVLGLAFETSMELGGRQWHLRLYPTVDYLIGEQDWSMWFVLAGGLLFVGLMTAGLLMLSGREAVVHALVQERTRELEETHQLQAAVLSAAGSAIITGTPAGVITSFNAAAERMLGYRAAELVGRATPAVFHDADEVVKRAAELTQELGRLVPPGFESFVAKARTGVLDTHEWTYVRKDGSRFPVLLTVTALRDRKGGITGFLGVAVDLTEQKKIESEKKGLISILDESPDFIGTADLEGNLMYHNLAAKELVGLPREHAMVGMKIADMHPEWAARLVLEKGVPAVYEKGSWQAETALRHRNGQEIPVLQTLFLIRDTQGRPSYLATIMHDISDRLRKEEMFRSMADKQAQAGRELDRQRIAALNLMQDAVIDKAKLKERESELEKSNRDLEQFAYIASHDLQEPLRMVASYTQLLSKKYTEQLDAQAKEYIAFAVDGAVRMRRLIEDLLSYSRVQSQGKPLAKVDLNQVFRRAIENLGMVIQDKKASVTSDALPTVLADETQVMQLFQNLISNGLKFCRTGDVRVHVSVQDRGRDWLFGVADNGIGIEPQYLQKIFVIFKRLHTREEYPGTGIGLAVCQRIVERHGGRIWAESEPGHGAVFYFTMPKPA